MNMKQISKKLAQHFNLEVCRNTQECMNVNSNEFILLFTTQDVSLHKTDLSREDVKFLLSLESDFSIHTSDDAVVVLFES